MQSLSADKFAIPIELPLGGQLRTVVMGPFEHSAERQFTLAVQHKAIDECHDLAKIKQISKHLLESWAALNTGFQGMMLENMQLRQALAQRNPLKLWKTVALGSLLINFVLLLVLLR